MDNKAGVVIEQYLFQCAGFLNKTLDLIAEVNRHRDHGENQDCKGERSEVFPNDIPVYNFTF
jgi:hypothetical protein